MRHVAEQDRAGAAFGAVAAQFRSGESEFVAQRPRQCLLLHDVHATALSIDVQADEPFARAARPVNRGAAKQVAGGGDCRASGDYTFYEPAPRDCFGRVPKYDQL